MRPVYVLATASLILAACTDSPAEENLGESEHGIVVDNRISSNRISSNRLKANQVALGDLLTTPEGVELFSFLISCALPTGQTLVANDPLAPGSTIEFPGEVGLAPRWLDHPMNQRDKRWVSACMFSRVNELNQIVSISMRGPSFALDSSSAERAAYPLQEGAFYGDMFTPLNKPIEWFACSGRDKTNANAQVGGLANRHCTEEDPAHPGTTLCGFTYAGDCADFVAPANKYACKREVFGADGFYMACREDEDYGSNGGHGGNGHGNGGHGRSRDHGDDDDSDHDDGDCDHDDDHGGNGQTTTYHQVITTYTQTH